MTDRCSLVFPVWPSTLALNTSSWLRRSALFGGPTWRPWPQTTRFCLLLMHLPRFEPRRLFQAAGAANGCAALHQWLPVLRNQYFSAATKLLVLRSRIAPGMTYGIELWRPAKNGANMMAVLTRAAKLISGIHREASHMAFFKDRSVNQDVMLADLDILSAADHCRMTHARRYARRATSAAAAATYVHNDPCSPFSALSCQLRMHRITWELLPGMACTLRTHGACTPARAMRQRCRTASAPTLHQHAQRQTWWVR